MGLEDLKKLDEAFNATEPAKQGDSWKPIPEDTRVKGVIVSQKPAYVGSKGTPVCKVKFEVVEPGEYAPRKVFHDIWLTEANLPYLKRDLCILGWPGLTADGKTVSGYRVSQLMSPTDTSLIGLGADFTVGVEMYEATDPQTGQKVQKSKNYIKFFNATYRYHPTNSKPEQSTAQTDDGIPF